MTIDFREFHNTKNLEEQRRLYAACFPEDHTSFGAAPDHYFWKFHGIPSPKQKSFEYASWNDLKLIGYYAALPYPYVLKGKPTTCGMVCDVMTHPEAQGKGVFTKLGRYSLTQLKTEGVGFVSGYPIRPSVLPGHLKVGWSVFFPLPLYVKIMGTKSILKKAGLGVFSFLPNLVIKSLQMPFAKIRAHRSPGTRCQVFELTDFLNLNAYDAFLEKWKASNVNYLDKNREFLKWRLGAPRTHYRILTVWKNEEVLSVAICRKLAFQGIDCLVLLDFMALPGNPEGLFEMHNLIEKEARHQNADMVTLMASQTTARRLRLLSEGFIRSPKGFKLIVNALDPSLNSESLRNEKNWNLMWIDSDDN